MRSFAAEPKEGERYLACISRSYRLGARKALAYGAFGGVIGTLGQYAVCLVLWYGGTLCIQGQIGPGELTSFLLYTIFIAVALGGLSDLFGTLMTALGASERVFGLLDAQPAIRTEGGIALDQLLGRLELEAISFSYPSRPDVRVLDNVRCAAAPPRRPRRRPPRNPRRPRRPRRPRPPRRPRRLGTALACNSAPPACTSEPPACAWQVSLTVQPGSVLALCGPSGSGKSSVRARSSRHSSRGVLVACALHARRGVRTAH